MVGLLAALETIGHMSQSYLGALWRLSLADVEASRAASMISGDYCLKAAHFEDALDA